MRTVAALFCFPGGQVGGRERESGQSRIRNAGAERVVLDPVNMGSQRRVLEEGFRLRR